MEKNIDVQFKLKKIEIIETGLTLPETDEQKITTYNFNINIEHRIIKDSQLLHNIVSVGIYGLNSEHLLGHLKVAYSFEIDNFKDFVSKNNVKLPEQILTMFNSVAISTTRGIMFSQFRGTFLHNAFLPVVDPNRFKKE